MALNRQISPTSTWFEPKRSKYRNKRVSLDGHSFDSQAEAKRWAELKILERAGEIWGLTRQVKWPVFINEAHCFTWVADFVYHTTADNARVVEDVKGMRTALYKLKKKCVEAYYGFEITEIKA